MSGEEVDVNDWLIEAAGEDDIDRARHYRNKYGQSFFNSSEPLHIAAEGGFFNICKYLVEERGVNVNELNSADETPLHAACSWIKGNETNYVKIVELLLDNGADLSIPDPSGLTPFHTAGEHGRKELINVFLDTGVSVDIRSRDGCTPLHFACGNGNKEFVKIMCQNKANVNLRNEKGWSPLHTAAFWGFGVGVIETLLEFGSNVDVQGGMLETALHCTTPVKGEIALILLDNGCDINLETSRGVTALGVIITRAKLTDDDCDEETMHDILRGIDIGSDADDDDDFQPDEYPTVMILKQHLVKLKSAKLFVSEKNMSHLDNNDFSDYENQCREEINTTRNEQLHVGITLFDILSTGVNPMYPKNKALMEALKHINWDSFPLYKSIIINNVKKSQLRHDSLESGKQWLCTLLKTSNVLNEFPVPVKIMSTEILTVIVSHLSNEDLNTLIFCGKELRNQVVHSSSDIGASAP